MALTPNSTAHLQQIITELQTGNRLLMSLVNQLSQGVAILNKVPASTVAALPVTGSAGQFFWASNGRKGGEGIGAGTGLFVYWNPATSQWFTFSGNVQVTS